MPATGSGVAAVLPSPYYIPDTKYGAMSQAPSSAASYENYSKLQKDRLDAPFFLSGRPAGAKVTGDVGVPSTRPVFGHNTMYMWLKL